MFKLFKNKNLASNPYLNWMELLLVLLFLWFVMSGIFERKFIFYGVGSCLCISLLCLKTLCLPGIKSDRQYFILHVNIFSFISYFLWLIKEIIKSSLSVTWNVFSGKKSLNPHIVWFKADYDNPAARALLANSITLTPGTVTVDIQDDGTYSVHALTDECAAGLLDGTMQQKVAHVFRETIDFRALDTTMTDPENMEAHLTTKEHKMEGKIHRL